MRYLIPALVMGLFILSCGNNNSENSDSNANSPAQSMVKKKAVDNGKGIGEIKTVTLATPLDQGMSNKGKAIYEMKCSACHKLTDQRVVGPGWAGLTTKRKPEWIMNMITNVDVMLAEDATAQKLLEECLVRMPNQNISIGDSRDILEFMRKNDGEE